MKALLASVADHLKSGAYANEAAVREGIVVPILRELGWNPSDPNHLKPEHRSEAGFADYVLFGRARKVAVIIEVKAVGRVLQGDRQLFRYCFELGAPLAILTDGRTWDFYFPSGQGSIEERRLYSLTIDERAFTESEEIFRRYLARARVLDRAAFVSVREDYERALSVREAVQALPDAWTELLSEADDVLVDRVQQKAEAISGYRPDSLDVLRFLGGLHRGGSANAPPKVSPPTPTEIPAEGPVVSVDPASSAAGVRWRLFGSEGSARFASDALVAILRTIVARDPAKVSDLAELVRSPKRNHIARSPLEVAPGRPDLARAEEIAPGWYVGLNIANRDKAMIVRAACEVYGLSIPGDLEVSFPNA